MSIKCEDCERKRVKRDSWEIYCGQDERKREERKKERKLWSLGSIAYRSTIVAD